MSDFRRAAPSGEDSTATKPELWRPLADAVGGFDLDPCASKSSDLAETNIRESGGLKADWSAHDTVWCNHPYARGQPPKWLKKAAAADCQTVVTLSKGDPSADWFHDYLTDATLICFPNTRMQFVGENNGAKFPNVYGVFGDCPAELRDWFEAQGWVSEP